MCVQTYQPLPNFVFCASYIPLQPPRGSVSHLLHAPPSFGCVLIPPCLPTGSALQGQALQAARLAGDMTCPAGMLLLWGDGDGVGHFFFHPMDCVYKSLSVLLLFVLYICVAGGLFPPPPLFFFSFGFLLR